MYALILELVGKGTRWEFAKREIRIGRDPNCDLVLPTDEYPMVSRSHLLIRLASERYWVEDLNTPGGTFVNGAQIQVNPLVDGDLLQLGVDGPKLRAQIVTSYRLESSDVPARRQASSEEAPTGLLKVTPSRSSQEAPTGGKVVVGTGLVEEPQAGTIASDRADSLDQPGAAAPEAPQEIAPSIGVRSAPVQEEGIPAKDLAGDAPGPAAGRTEPPKSPTSATPLRSSDARPLPHELAIVDRKLNALRNMMILTIVLIVILGAVLFYHLRG